MAHFPFPNIYFISFYPFFIICKVMQALSSGPESHTPNYRCPLFMHINWDWRQDQQALFSHYNANRHRWPRPEQGIKSVGQHPMGEPWAVPQSGTTVIGRRKLEINLNCEERTVPSLSWQMMMRYIRMKLNVSREMAFCHCQLKSNTSRGFHLGLIGTFIYISEHFK